MQALALQFGASIVEQLPLLWSLTASPLMVDGDGALPPLLMGKGSNAESIQERSHDRCPSEVECWHLTVCFSSRCPGARVLGGQYSDAATSRCASCSKCSMGNDKGKAQSSLSSAFRRQAQFHMMLALATCTTLLRTWPQNARPGTLRLLPQHSLAFLASIPVIKVCFKAPGKSAARTVITRQYKSWFLLFIQPMHQELGRHCPDFPCGTFHHKREHLVDNQPTHCFSG